MSKQNDNADTSGRRIGPADITAIKLGDQNILSVRDFGLNDDQVASSCGAGGDKLIQRLVSSADRDSPSGITLVALERGGKPGASVIAAFKAVDADIVAR